MGLKKDWTFAHFLYYMFRISFWLFLGSMIIQLTVPIIAALNYEKSFVTGYPVPIRMEVDEFDTFRTIENDEVAISISKNVTGTMLLEANLSDNIWAFLFYNLVIYSKWIAVLISLFFGARLFKNIAEGKHFNVKNPNYLFIIGGTLLLASIGFIIVSLIPLPIINGITQPDFVTIKHIVLADNNFMVGGIACIVFGYVFKEGNRINEEQKLTV